MNTEIKDYTPSDEALDDFIARHDWGASLTRDNFLTIIDDARSMHLLEKRDCAGIEDPAAQIENYKEFVGALQALAAHCNFLQEPSPESIANKIMAHAAELQTQRDALLEALLLEKAAKEAESEHDYTCAYASCGFRGCPHSEIWDALSAVEKAKRDAISKCERSTL